MNKLNLSGIKCLTGNQLKIIALIAMTLDHIGLQLLPQYPFLRNIGRLSFPLFSYMIAEGCLYTKNRKKYLFRIAFIATICQLVYYFAMGSLYQCILVTFTLSICLIYAIDNAKCTPGILSLSIALISILLSIFICSYLPVTLYPQTDFAIDYGIWGVFLAVFIYFTPNRFKGITTLVALLPLCFTAQDNQWYCLFAVILLMLYNGKRGKSNMKNLFYIYYPAHLVIIFIISQFISMHN